MEGRLCVSCAVHKYAMETRDELAIGRLSSSKQANTVITVYEKYPAATFGDMSVVVLKFVIPDI